jgi:hypothetical protein
VSRATDSHLWKAIIKLWPLLNAQSWWTVGDGQSIEFCNDAWIEEGLRLVECNLQIPDHLKNAKLIDIVNDGTWNWNLLSTWVPTNVMAKIAAILPPDPSHGVDTRVCKENAMGIFSIAEMYHALCDFDIEGTGVVWQHIWKLKVPERVRAFIWLIKHGRLLTNERKNRMGLGTDRCDYCGDLPETILHGDWSSFWAMVCHLVWSWRKKEKFEEDFIRPIKPV